ncbi:MAG: hypothetical protein FJW39_24275 [Acidobacteria bacterium]|nr:hypothetical protein [Acidobacteriota bacterium]
MSSSSTSSAAATGPAIISPDPAPGHQPTCSICTHPDREAIDLALLPTPLRDIAAQYGVSKSALQRHRTTHLAALAAQSRHVFSQRIALAAPRLRDRLEELHAHAEEIFQSSAGIENSTALRAAVPGNTSFAPSHVERMSKAILGAFAPHPELRDAVAAALAKVEAEFTPTVLGLQPDPVQARILRAPTRGFCSTARVNGANPPSSPRSPSITAAAPLTPKPDGVNRYSLLMLNQSRAVALPGKENTIRRFSAPSLVVVDEVALVPDAVYSAVRPMLAASATGRMILLSTPRGRRGFFYDEWTGGQPWLWDTRSQLFSPELLSRALTNEFSHWSL